MCAHSEQGALGLIINKPIEGLPFRELMIKMEIPVTATTSSAPVLFGASMITPLSVEYPQPLRKPSSRWTGDWQARAFGG